MNVNAMKENFYEHFAEIYFGFEQKSGSRVTKKKLSVLLKSAKKLKKFIWTLNFLRIKNDEIYSFDL